MANKNFDVDLLDLIFLIIEGKVKHSVAFRGIKSAISRNLPEKTCKIILAREARFKCERGERCSMDNFCEESVRNKTIKEIRGKLGV